MDVLGGQRGRWAGLGRLATVGALLLAGQAASLTAASAAESQPGGASASWAACQYAPTHRAVQIRESGIREASALVASQQFPGVYWTLNDSGNAPALYAFDDEGAPRGTFRVSGAANVDWEALQIGPGEDGGFALYIGDLGDNDQLRRDPVIYRIPEPEPMAPGEGARVSETAPATVLRFVYPANPHNTEAMVVHPKTGEIVLFTREVNGMSMIYRLPMPLDAGTIPIAELIDVVNVRSLDPASDQVTDASISSDGQQIAVRTYGSVLVYDVPGGILKDRVWEQTPAVHRLVDGPKGEGITFRFDGGDLLTIGEDKNAPAWLYQTDQHC